MRGSRLSRSTTVAGATLWAGVLGPVVFVVVFMIDGFVHPAYDPAADFVSELSRGAFGWVQVVNFLLFGLAMLAFAWGARVDAPTTLRSTWGPALFASMGVGLLAAGMFVTDPRTVTQHTLPGTLHLVASVPVFLGVISVCFVYAFKLAGGFRVYSIATGIFVVVDLAATFTIGMTLQVGGLMQRVAIGAGWAWIAVFALLLRRRRHEEEAAEHEVPVIPGRTALAG